MSDDFRSFAEFPRRWERPSTSLGRWSLGLLAGFVGLMVLFFAVMSHYGGLNGASRSAAKSGGGFFSVPSLAWTLVAASLSGAAAFVAAYAAVTGKGERSILMLLPLIVGGLAIIIAIGAIVGSR